MNNEKDLYERLMIQQQNPKSGFHCYKLSDNVLLFRNGSWNNRQIFFVNISTEKVYELTDKDGYFHTFTANDIDFRVVDSLEKNHNAHRLPAQYYFGVFDFKDGVAMVQWTLYPDGRYFADEDGFGAEDNDEVNVYAFIDENSRVLIPFTSMNREQQEKFRKQAIQLRGV